MSACPFRFALSRRCCNQHGLFLTDNLTSSGQIIILCTAAGPLQLRSLLISFVELCYLVFTSNFLRHLSHSLDIASITGSGKFLSSLISFILLSQTKADLSLMVLLQANRSVLFELFLCDLHQRKVGHSCPKALAILLPLPLILILTSRSPNFISNSKSRE